MRVLVTGSRGVIGSALVDELRRSCRAVVGYDLQDDRDILHLPTLREAIRGCDAIVHAAAHLGLPNESPEQVVAAVSVHPGYRAMGTTEGTGRPAAKAT